MANWAISCIIRSLFSCWLLSSSLIKYKSSRSVRCCCIHHCRSSKKNAFLWTKTQNVVSRAIFMCLAREKHNEIHKDIRFNIIALDSIRRNNNNIKNYSKKRHTYTFYTVLVYRASTLFFGFLYCRRDWPQMAIRKKP